MFNLRVKIYMVVMWGRFPMDGVIHIVSQGVIQRILLTYTYTIVTAGCYGLS